MTQTTTPERARPEAIKAVPVRHPGRWIAMVVIAILAAMFLNMLLTNKAFNWSFMFENMFKPPVLEGVRTTLLMTVLSMALGIVFGVVLAVMRLSPNPIVNGVAWLYVWFFRAVPRLVLLTLCGNLGILYAKYSVGLPFGRQIAGLFGLDNNLQIFGLNANQIAQGFMAGLIGLALSEAAYMAEIVRAGISSIDPGQQEAASALGMSRMLTMRRIVLPQAMRVIVPPTGNETIAMLKDTSLLIAVPVSNELFFQLEAIGARTFQIFPMLVAACLWYLALSSLLMVGQYFLEKRFSRGFGSEGRSRRRIQAIQSTLGQA
jgi:polar amino acid transport system permease protein